MALEKITYYNITISPVAFMGMSISTFTTITPWGKKL